MLEGVGGGDEDGWSLNMRSEFFLSSSRLKKLTECRRYMYIHIGCVSRDGWSFFCVVS